MGTPLPRLQPHRRVNCILGSNLLKGFIIHATCAAQLASSGNSVEDILANRTFRAVQHVLFTVLQIGIIILPCLTPVNGMVDRTRFDQNPVPCRKIRKFQGAAEVLHDAENLIMNELRRSIPSMSTYPSTRIGFMLIIDGNHRQQL